MALASHKIFNFYHESSYDEDEFYDSLECEKEDVAEFSLLIQESGEPSEDISMTLKVSGDETNFPNDGMSLSTAMIDKEELDDDNDEADDDDAKKNDDNDKEDVNNEDEGSETDGYGYGFALGNL